MLTIHNYENLVASVKLMGHNSAPRGQSTFEFIGSSFYTHSQETVWRKGMNTKLAILEGLMFVGGFFDLNFIKAVAPKANLDLYLYQSDYGRRVNYQILACYNMLKEDSDTRRAVMYFNSPLHTTDHSLAKDMACTTTYQFLLRDGLLHSHVSMRSSDIVYGLPMDLVMFGMMNQYMARLLQVENGIVTLSAGSSHLYESTQHLAESRGKFYFTIPEWDYSSFYTAKEYAFVAALGLSEGASLSEVGFWTKKEAGEDNLKGVVL